MNRHNRLRQAHRALATLFTLTFLVNLAAIAWGSYERPIGVATAAAFGLLLLTGLSLLVLPHAAKWRSRRAGR